jgi:hypothetical protein
VRPENDLRDEMYVINWLMILIAEGDEPKVITMYPVPNYTPKWYERAGMHKRAERFRLIEILVPPGGYVKQ